MSGQLTEKLQHGLKTDKKSISPYNEDASLVVLDKSKSHSVNQSFTVLHPAKTEDQIISNRMEATEDNIMDHEPEIIEEKDLSGYSPVKGDG